MTTPLAHTIVGCAIALWGGLQLAVRQALIHRPRPLAASWLMLATKTQRRELRLAQARRQRKLERARAEEAAEVVPEMPELADYAAYEYHRAAETQRHAERLQAIYELSRLDIDGEKRAHQDLQLAPQGIGGADRDPCPPDAFYLGYDDEDWEEDDPSPGDDLSLPDPVRARDFDDPITDLFMTATQDGSKAKAEVSPQDAAREVVELILDETTPPSWFLDQLVYSRQSDLARILLAHRLIYRLTNTGFQPLPTESPEEEELTFERPASPSTVIQVRSGIGRHKGHKMILPTLAAPVQLQALYRPPAGAPDVPLRPALRPPLIGTIRAVLASVSRHVRYLDAQLREAPPCGGCGAPLLPKQATCPVCCCAPVPAGASPEEAEAILKEGQRKRAEVTVLRVLLDSGFAETTGAERVDVGRGCRTFARNVPDLLFDVLMQVDFTGEEYMSVLARPLYRHPKRGPVIRGRSCGLNFTPDVDMEWLARKTRFLIRVITQRILVGAGRLKCRCCGAPTYKTQQRLRACVNGCRQRMKARQRAARPEHIQARIRRRKTWRGYLEDVLGLDCSHTPVWEDEDLAVEDLVALLPG